MKRQTSIDVIMRVQKFALSIAICMLLSFAPSAAASWRFAENSLNDDRALFKKEFRNLVRERKEYEEKNEDLEKDLRSIEERYTKCTSERWRIIWRKQIERAEEARRKLENERGKLVQLNRALKSRNTELDKERSIIDVSHKIKDEKYESEFRNWMVKFDAEYITRMKLELFRGYEEYMSGMRKYIYFIEGAITKCKNNNYMESIAENVISFIPEIISATKSLRGILKKDH